MQQEERLWQLVTLKLSGEASAEELAELASLLTQFPELEFKAAMLEKVWLNKNKTTIPDLNNAFDKHLQRLSNHLSQPTLQYEREETTTKTTTTGKTGAARKYWIWGSAIAASIVGIMLVMNVYNSDNKPAFLSPQNIITTRPGSKSKVNLPDGTVVWLNSDSKIIYHDDFGENNKREIELVGEAYFDVVKDKTRPFIIHSKNIDVRVLGTAFNVRAYPDEPNAETSLIRGVVEVTLRNNPDKKLILKPNEKLVVRDVPEVVAQKQKQMQDLQDEPLITLSKLHYFKSDSSAVETSWIKNRLAFEGETLEAVAKKIERWYGVAITIADERLKDDKYTSVFEDESLAEVMNALKLTGNFNYTINKKQVIIKR